MEDKGKVIQFPLKGNPNFDIKVDSTGLELQQDMLFAEQLTEGLVVNMIHNMYENGINTEDESFICDVAVMIELVKSAIYRDLGISHPLQDVVDTFVTANKEGKKISVTFDPELMKGILVEDEEEE